MESAENIQQFYNRVFGKEATQKSINNADVGHFNVFSRDHCSHISPYRRRDFFKISLIIGIGTLHYADRWIKIDRPALLFSNPQIPYSWEPESIDQKGWFCLFSDQFLLNNTLGKDLQDFPLFRPGGNPIYFLDEKQVNNIDSIFKNMDEELNSKYLYKYDLLRNYLQLILHEALKMSPATHYNKNTNASQRVVNLFMELLERQFPVDGLENNLFLKNAVDFANKLNIHVNSLNRYVKHVTGKTTSDLIAERLTKEAKALLQFTDWNINEIATVLGFEEVAYFSNHFKKRVGLSPNQYRLNIV